MEEYQNKPPHQLLLKQRNQLTVTGVAEVVSFDEHEVLTKTPIGQLLIRGNGLQVEKADVTSGELLVTGEINELLYSKASSAPGLFGRLFGAG